MAKELAADFTSGTTIYFLLRNSVGSVWNGSAFVAYVTANYATYALTGTEQGTASGYYTADMPSVAAGAYCVTAKKQAGGSPAEADLSVAQGNVNWTGTAVETVAGILDLTDGVESNRTLRQSLRLMLAALVGKLSGASGTTITIRDTNDTKNRIVATVDSDGDRTALTLDAS